MTFCAAHSSELSAHLLLLHPSFSVIPCTCSDSRILMKSPTFTWPMSALLCFRNSLEPGSETWTRSRIDPAWIHVLRRK